MSAQAKPLCALPSENVSMIALAIKSALSSGAKWDGRKSGRYSG
jgi:hypothetical protein